MRPLAIPLLPALPALPALAALALIAAAETPARADLNFQVATGGGIAWMRSMPTLQSQAISGSARTLSAQDVATGGGSVTALGGSFDVSVVLDDHWLLPGFGFGAYAAIGTYPSVLTSVDGSVARVRPWTMVEVDLLGPGIGYRIKKRRFMFSGTLRAGLSMLRVGSSIASGADAQEVALTGLSPLVQAELEACRRVDPVTRVCLQIAPRLYDFGGLNGATFGLRVEWGR